MTAEAPPSRLPWPPILVIATLGGGLLLDRLLGEGFNLFGRLTQLPLLGAAILTPALATDMWCALTLHRLDTTIMPHRAVSNLATVGPYRFSRNPIYVAHVAATVGLALMLRSLGATLLTPLLIFGLIKLAIEQEERHLRQKFGAAFADYCASTPRWLWPPARHGEERS